MICPRNSSPVQEQEESERRYFARPSEFGAALILLKATLLDMQEINKRESKIPLTWRLL
jgi:hypothetical protein